MKGTGAFPSFTSSETALSGKKRSLVQKPISMRSEVLRELERTSYSFVDGTAMCRELESSGSLGDWEEFSASWSDLPTDAYMAGGEKYRQRRYEVLHTDSVSRAITRQPPEAHHQSAAYNCLNGGVKRWYLPFRAALAQGPSFCTILKAARDIFEALSPVRAWQIEAHQFRIVTTGNENGEPAPEGIHRDGVNFALVMLIDRVNVNGGISTIYRDQNMLSIGNSTLMRPFDSLFLVDTHVKHGVSAISAKNPRRIGTRDVLVVTFTSRQAEGGILPVPGVEAVRQSEDRFLYGGGA
jgi:hypothetical protein